MTTAEASSDNRRRYAFVGTGHRAEMYFAALLDSHADVGTPVALCDTNHTRMAYYQEMGQRAQPGLPPLPAYSAEKFESMLNEQRPDAVVVTTIDSMHARFITAALNHGCDVITEKPLTTDLAGCRQIIDAAEANDSELTVTFNYRYSPRNSVVKELLLDGAVGMVTSVHFEWLLDTVHGADYFRRWHRSKSASGGLLVHKAAHHFDLVNWWLADLPSTVFAFGALGFYGPDGRARRLSSRDSRADPFALDLASQPRLRALYLDARHEDGYDRDRDVFSDGIDIEDNMAVLVRYQQGAMLSYALNAHAPWEGYRVGINGTEGRLELAACERADVSFESPEDVLGRPRRPAIDPSAVRDARASPNRGARKEGTEVILQRHWEPARHVSVPEGGSAHGGGDERLLDDLFRDRRSEDRLGRKAGYIDGVRSVVIGAAANLAIAEGAPVQVDDLGVAMRPTASTTT